jgi:membrane-associated HD superfamily phosphohydrolase
MDVELIKKDPSKSLSAMFYINFAVAVIVILADLIVIVLKRRDKLRITASLVLFYLKLVVSCVAFDRCVNFSNVPLDIIIFILLAPFLKDKFVILQESGLVLSFASSCSVACQFLGEEG